MRDVSLFGVHKIKPSVRKKIKVYLYFVPALGILGFSVVYPWIWSLMMSFSKWRISTGKPPAFIGLENYRYILTNKDFQLSMINSLRFMVISVTLQFFCGLCLALLLNRKLVFRKMIMVGILLPYMLTPTMVGLVWKMLLNNSWGVINYYLRGIGLHVPDWLGDPKATMWTLGIITTWLHTPWCCLMLFSGLQAISDELIEASKVDGANAWQSFIHVTLPALRPVLIIVISFRIVFSLREFDVIYSIYNAGGPGNSAMVMGIYLFNTFSKNWDIGRSSAISFIMLIITFALSTGIFMRKGDRNDSKLH